MVQDLRRTFIHGSSVDEARGRLRGDVADARLQARAARVLRRESSKYQGRIAEAKRLPQRDGRLRSIADGVSDGVTAPRQRALAESACVLTWDIAGETFDDMFGVSKRHRPVHRS